MSLQQLKSPLNPALTRISYPATVGASSNIVGGPMKPQESLVSPLQQVIMQPSLSLDDQLQSPPYALAQQSFMPLAADKLGGNSRSFQQPPPINPSPYIGNTGTCECCIANNFCAAKHSISIEFNNYAMCSFR